jgi:hypothetical protein
MSRPEVADAEGGHQMRKVAANILSSHEQPTKSVHPPCVLGGRMTPYHNDVEHCGSMKGRNFIDQPSDYQRLKNNAVCRARCTANSTQPDSLIPVKIKRNFGLF